ncbi:MAG TPA: hypothetical protein VGY96_11335 [Streptosporangiaceae bacterium]|jgi:hypothetical protein|nr:hypothetical protein [Streptosporangiaceae bacterium]HJY00491.1 hypothetical protein [Streptosporangiaceae bacterium]HTB55901.1 hypothetical protein [Trebonia sp.]
MKTVNIDVTVDAPMPEAQGRILDRVDHRLRSVGFTGRPLDGALVYRPKFIGLPLVWLVRRLQNEHVAFTFTEQGLVTDVRAAGRLRDRARAEVTEALGGR